MNGIVGPLTTAAANELGIAPGIPVTSGTIDSITSAIGSGAFTANDGSVIIGTTSVLVSHIGEHRGDLFAGILAVPSPLTGMYYVMAENGVGGRALEWAMRLFGYGDDFAAATADAGTIDVGADGVHFLPWLLGSIAPQPNDDIRAAFAGLSLRHDRRHLVRAVDGRRRRQPGLVATRRRVVRRPRIRHGAIRRRRRAERSVGADLADALDRPVHQLEEPRATNARGAAFLAFAPLGVLVHRRRAVAAASPSSSANPIRRTVKQWTRHFDGSPTFTERSST